ncbi:thiol-disulfide oxidoreductase DCC family protein [Taklimakanibacter deserti]|uniref:thiol-disulfide oxidoreductase DCC family protein n=1 Tax=Taklimakanibacter deserti TaxID=2267839 RepID=UPI0013C3FD22
MRKDWKPVPAADLPDGLLLFDGLCHVCSGSVRFLLERDHTQQFTYVPCQSPWGNEIMGRFGIDRDFAESFAFVDKGQILFKSDAAIAAASRLRAWRWISLLRYVPRALRDWAYDILARNRYNWFGKRDTCLVLPPETRARFLTEAPSKR